ncbi:hypothetical protein, partial [Burkholderia sp. SIMBA_051]|uniref:hypothetical protein n=1 Tax=Burkholderia sp. SIMBA_051 TaxID=3085792 RepID=UPI00397A58CA
QTSCRRGGQNHDAPHPDAALESRAWLLPNEEAVRGCSGEVPHVDRGAQGCAPASMDIAFSQDIL